jgi:hypothetical protein
MAGQTKIKVPKFNRLFAVKKYKEKRYFRKSTMTDEELLSLREEMHITPHIKGEPYTGGTNPKPL